MARKLIVTGPPRSGTTVLADMISRHEHVALTVENDFAQIAGSLHAAFDKAREHQNYLDSAPVIASPGQADAYAELAAMRDGGFADAPEWDNPGQQTLAERFERLLAAWFIDATGKPDAVWVGDKMPDVFAKTALAQAMETIADIHFIYIFRNPVAMIASSMRRRADTLAGRDTWGLHGLDDDISVWLRNWQTCQRLIAAGHKVHVVKYEDLVDQTSATMDAVFAFLGVEPLSLQCRLYDTPKALQSRYMSERDEAYVTGLMESLVLRWHEPLAELIRLDPVIPCLVARGTQLTMIDLRVFQLGALDFGFYPPDDWCRWTMASAGIKVHMFERERPTGVLMDFAAYDAPGADGMLDMAINGQSVLQIDPTFCTAARNGCRLALPLPATGPTVTITLTNPRYKPAETPDCADPRELGVALRSLTFI